MLFGKPIAKNYTSIARRAVILKKREKKEANVSLRKNIETQRIEGREKEGKEERDARLYI